MIFCIAAVSISFAYDRVDISDMIFKMAPKEENSFEYKFAQGDTIILNASVQKGNSISRIGVIEWPSSIRFQAYDVNEIVDKKITVNRTNVYLFKISNEAIFKSQTYQLKIQRIPTSQEFINFNSAVAWDTTYDTTYVASIETSLVKIDTVHEEIVNTQLKLGSQLTGSTRSYIPVNLPKNTIRWAYWIGVGQEAADGLQAMVNTLPKAAELLGITNPVAAFALGLTPNLFRMNQGLDINYYFIPDYTNACNFMNLQKFYFNPLHYGQKIVTNYSKINSVNEKSFYLGLDNSDSKVTSKLVTVKIVAVKVFRNFKIHKVKKPEITQRVTPKLND